ncbi:MAG: biotin transporter BioY [Gemmobacter sp.]|uniref:biotin transporter BioY n=1 Tax=Gemmobacter sp. TaxID=1898957 RepID=UPI001A55A888|nr:biotin transporter BioY [Gemmobacter sp.]MBL8561426.1 biotin transporter BioY [Gemmobacter sp.]
MERNLTHIALFAALIAALGFLPKIDLVSGVPITAQSLGVMLCGTVLGARRGALAVLLFLAVALAVPVLAGFRTTLMALNSPTAGYIIGFPLAAFTAGLVVERLRIDIFPAAFLGAVLGGIGVLHVCGILGMSVMLEKTLPEAAVLALPFLAGDLLTAGLAAAVTRSIARLRPASVLSRA